MARGAKKLTTLRLSVQGMHCASCVANVEKRFNGVPGVHSASVNLLNNSAVVEYEVGRTTPAEIIASLSDTNFRASEVVDDTQFFLESNKKSETKNSIVNVVVSAVLTVLVVCLCMVAPVHSAAKSVIAAALPQAFVGVNGVEGAAVNFVLNVVLLALTIPVQFVCGWTFIKGAVASIKSKSLNMDVLVASGTLLAFLMSLYITFEPLIYNDWSRPVMQFTNMGMPFFETSCMVICFVLIGRAIEERAKAASNSAVETLVNLVPQDVAVVTGFENVEDFQKKGAESYETAGAKLVDVKVGSLIVVEPGQSIPLDGKVVRGSTEIDNSMITGESDLVPIKPGLTVSAGTTNVTARIVVETTSTIGQSTLATLIRSVVDAQNNKPPVQRLADKIAGIFVPAVLAIALVTFIVRLAIFGLSANSIISALLCAVSVCVVACPCSLGLATPTAIAVGMGVALRFGIVLKDGAMLEQMSKLAHFVFDKTGTLTQANIDNKIRSKEIRPEAVEAITKIQNDLGASTYLVSGDKREEVFRVANAVGIPLANVVYECLPQTKLDFIADLIAKTKGTSKDAKVAFVGDGINDAPALAAADIGFSLQQSTDVALESGDVILMRNNLLDIITGMRISAATMRKIKQNLFWALIYNVCMIPLAAFGVFSPAVGGAAMAASSICVVLNSLFLRRFKDNS